MNSDRNQMTINYSKKKGSRRLSKDAKVEEEEYTLEKNKMLYISEQIGDKNVSTRSIAEKKRNKRKSTEKEDESNAKIDSYCNKRGRSSKVSSVHDSKILLNLTYINNQLEMSKEKANIECGGSTIMQIESEPNQNVLSTQSSFNNFATGNMNEEEEEGPNTLNNLNGMKNYNITQLKKSLKEYTVQELEEKYNFDRCLLESEEKLLSSRSNNYFVNQKHIDKRMRHILLDWVMEVCSQLSFRRATYHLAVVLIDVFLSKIENVQTNLLQLTGATCLIIAAKSEEIIIPSFAAFSHCTDKAYSANEILINEKYVLNVLKWKINHPSLAFWSNYISLKWDEFSADFNSKYAYDLGFFNGLKLPKFRSNSTEEYFLFRNFYQLIDIISLDFDALQYSDKIIAAAVIYLLLGLFLKIFDITQIVREFHNDYSVFASFYDLNMIFNRFLLNFLNCELDDVLDHIVFVSYFFNLKFDYSAPMIQKEDKTEGFSYEELLQIQTHNPFNIVSVEHIINIRNSVTNSFHCIDEDGVDDVGNRK